MPKPPNSKKPALTERERLQKLREAGFVRRLKPADIYEEWNRLCATLAEDALLDETLPVSQAEIDRIRKRIAQLVESHRRAESLPQKEKKSSRKRRPPFSTFST